MSRSRKKRTTRTRRLLTATVMLALLGWGLWQWRVVYASILRDVPREAAADPAPVLNDSVNAVSVSKLTQSGSEAALDADDVTVAADSAASQMSAGAPRNILVDQQEDVSTETLASRGREIDLLLAAADDAAEAGDVLGRREKLNQALALIGESARGPEVREQLAAINTGIFLSSDVIVQDPYAPLLSIEPGDSFTNLGRRYHLTPDLLMALNPQLSERDLRPGSGIKIPNGPFHARVVKHDLRLDLYVRDMYVCSYKIELDDGNFLPMGTYRVKPQGRNRVSVSDNQPPREWIAFEPLRGSSRGIDEAQFYGSTGPRGRPATLSGVRLDDSDLRTVYNALVERDSLVRVDP